MVLMLQTIICEAKRVESVLVVQFLLFYYCSYCKMKTLLLLAILFVVMVAVLSGNAIFPALTFKRII